MADRLVPLEEPEISELLKEKMSQRMEIHISTSAEEFKQKGDLISILTRDLATNEEKEFSAEKVLIAVGRRPNSDRLHPEKTGVQIDHKGFILVNEYLETTRKNIYAIGDAIGKQMFTHAANYEAQLAANNALDEQWQKMDFSITPHAIFSHPQIASAGLTEAEARKNHQVLTGKALYQHHTSGMAIMESKGFAKAVVEKESGKILGFHIIGPQASILIQEVANAMAQEGTVQSIRSTMHVHPAMQEIVKSALTNLKD